MVLDAPHGLPRLPPAPEFRRTQDTANSSHKEHIYLYVLAISQSLMLYSDNVFSRQISRRVTLASYFATALNSPTCMQGDNPL